MEQNKNKKVMLSIIGLAILIVGIVGITYAFFNYTRTGVANNIHVGRIYFNSEQGNAINLTNVFPIDKDDVNNDTDNVGSVTIHITGDTTYTEGVEYLVSVVDVNNTIGTGNNTKSLPISVDVSYSETENKTIGTSDSDYFDNRGGNASLYKVLAGKQIGEGNKLVVGYIKPDQVGVDGTITIKAFIDKDRIAITDTYPERTYTETIGEDTYEVNPNMSTEELNTCTSFFAFEIGTVTMNPNPTVSEINNCVDYFDNIGLGNSMQSGETVSAFCDGSGTFNGMTLQQLVDYNYLSSPMISELQEMNILIIQADSQVLEDFCNGTGEINGTTFQERLDSNYFNSSTLSYFKENHIINQLTYQTTNSWTDGTTSSWVNGRTVLTTNEWNSLQENGISFKIKVEANEGIWVPEQGNAMMAFPSDIFNSDSISGKVKEIYFNQMNNSLMIEKYNDATYKYDLTDNNEGTVLCWLEENEDDNTMYTMYVVSNGVTFFPSNLTYLFYNPRFTNVEKIEFNNVDTSRSTRMDNMFYYTSKLKRIDLRNFDTSDVTNMSSMFYGDSSLEYANLSGLDMQKVDSMDHMFSGALNLTEVYFTGSQTRDVTNMSSMLSSSNKLESVSLDGLGGDNLNNISSLFSSTSIKHISMRNFNFGQSASTFRWHSNLESIDLSNAIINANNLNNFFSGCYKLETVILDNIKIDNVKELIYMFEDCRSLVSVDLTSIDFSKMNSIHSMFKGASALETILVSDDFTIDNVSDSNAQDIFNGCTSLVGGAGTSYAENHIDYSSNHIDRVYAKIDGGISNPGYLTLKTN